MPQVDWEQIASHPSAVLIAGDVGRGKTALMGTHIDYARQQKLRLFSVNRNFPFCKKVGENYLPPRNSVLYVDDAHLSGLYAHGTGSAQTAFDFLQRQKRHGQHSILYSTQDTTGFTIRLIRLIDAICLFHPPMMAREYERSEIKPLYTKAVKVLPKELGHVWVKWLDKKSREVNEQVYSFSLPQWWTEDISTGRLTTKSMLANRAQPKDALRLSLEALRTIGKLFG